MSAGRFSWRRLHIWGPKKERNFLMWGLTHIAQSHWHIVASRNCQKIHQQRNPMRWGGRFTSCNPSHGYWHPEFVWQLSDGRSNNLRLHHDHRKRGSYGVAICSRGHSSSVAARRHWSCSEDYWSMRGALNSAFENWIIGDGFSSGRIGCWTTGQRSARKSQPSHDQYLALCNTQDRRRYRRRSCEGREGYRRGYQTTTQVCPYKLWSEKLADDIIALWR